MAIEITIEHTEEVSHTVTTVIESGSEPITSEPVNQEITNEAN